MWGYEPIQDHPGDKHNVRDTGGEVGIYGGTRCGAMNLSKITQETSTT